jgi:hypothetical protein
LSGLETLAHWPFLSLELGGCPNVDGLEVNTLLFMFLHLHQFVLRETFGELAEGIIGRELASGTVRPVNSATDRLLPSQSLFQVFLLYLRKYLFGLSRNLLKPFS